VCKGTARDVTIGPSAGDRCTGKPYVDQSFTGQNGLGTVVIEQGGTLIVPDQTPNIEAARFEVRGRLEAGTETCPIGRTRPENKVTMTFTGSRPCAMGNCPGNNKGIFVSAGGQLSLYGRKGTGTPEQSWTYLSKPSPVGDSSLDLADDIAPPAGGAWQAGDWIVVATTSFNPFETEFVRIKKPNSGSPAGARVDVDQKLKYAHFGSPIPVSRGRRTSDSGDLGSPAFVYDNALTIIALLLSRTDQSRATVLGDSFLYVQAHDPTRTDGRLRQAYWVGPFTLPFTSNDAYFVRPDGTVNLVGAPWFFQGSAVGDMAWAAIALAQLYARSRQGPASSRAPCDWRTGSWTTLSTPAAWVGTASGSTPTTCACRTSPSSTTPTSTRCSPIYWPR